MKGMEIMEFLKTQVIIEVPIETTKAKDNLELLSKYKEKARRAYNER